MESKEKNIPNWMLTFNKENDNGNSYAQAEPNKPILKFTGNIHYHSNISECGITCAEILSSLEEKELALGFDLEWPVDYKTGSGRTALIQLCANKHTCHLFHVIGWKSLPKILVQLINHPNVKLVGLNIKNDIYKLGRDFDIEINNVLANNVIDIGGLANKTLKCQQPWSLERLVLFTLKEQLPKTKSTRMSNWAAFELTDLQKEYAASDAYASLLVYQHLKQISSGIKHSKH